MQSGDSCISTCSRKKKSAQTKNSGMSSPEFLRGFLTRFRSRSGSITFATRIHVFLRTELSDGGAGNSAFKLRATRCQLGYELWILSLQVKQDPTDNSKVETE